MTTTAAPSFDVRTTPIRSRSTRHVDTARLLGRLEGLRDILADGRWAEQKCMFVHRVLEAIHIEDELAQRGVAAAPVTRRAR